MLDQDNGDNEELIDLASVIEAIKTASDKELAVLAEISSKLSNAAEQGEAVSRIQNIENVSSLILNEDNQAYQNREAQPASNATTFRPGEVEISLDINVNNGANSQTVTVNNSLTNINDAVSIAANLSSENNRNRNVTKPHQEEATPAQRPPARHTRHSQQGEKGATETKIQSPSTGGRTQSQLSTTATTATAATAKTAKTAATAKEDRFRNYRIDENGRLRTPTGQFASREEIEQHQSARGIASQRAQEKGQEEERGTIARLISSLNDLAKDRIGKRLGAGGNAVETAGVAAGGSFFYAFEEIYDVVKDAKDLSKKVGESSFIDFFRRREDPPAQLPARQSQQGEEGTTQAQEEATPAQRPARRKRQSQQGEEGTTQAQEEATPAQRPARRKRQSQQGEEGTTQAQEEATPAQLPARRKRQPQQGEEGTTQAQEEATPAQRPARHTRQPQQGEEGTTQAQEEATPSERKKNLSKISHAKSGQKKNNKTQEAKNQSFKRNQLEVLRESSKERDKKLTEISKKIDKLIKATKDNKPNNDLFANALDLIDLPSRTRRRGSITGENRSREERRRDQSNPGRDIDLDVDTDRDRTDRKNGNTSQDQDRTRNRTRGRLGSVISNSLDVASEVGSKAGNLFKGAASLAGKGLGRAIPILAPALAAYDGFKGFTDTEKQKEIFNLKDGEEASLGQKSSLAIGNILDLGGVVSGMAGFIGDGLGLLGLDGAKEALNFDSGDIAKGLYELFSFGSQEEKPKKEAIKESIPSLSEEAVKVLEKQSNINKSVEDGDFNNASFVSSQTDHFIKALAFREFELAESEEERSLLFGRIAKAQTEISDNEKVSNIVAINQAEQLKEDQKPKVVKLDSDTLLAINTPADRTQPTSTTTITNNNTTQHRSSAQTAKSSGSIPNNFNDLSLQRQAADLE